LSNPSLQHFLNPSILHVSQSLRVFTFFHSSVFVRVFTFFHASVFVRVFTVFFRTYTYLQTTCRIHHHGAQFLLCFCAASRRSVTCSASVPRSIWKRAGLTAPRAWGGGGVYFEPDLEALLLRKACFAMSSTLVLAMAGCMPKVKLDGM